MNRAIAGKVSDLSDGKLHKVSVEGKEILVVNVGGSYFAVDDTCTHSGSSLSEGELDGSTVTCGWHGAQFDCKTGNLEKFPAKINNLQSYKVVVESNDVIIEVWLEIKLIPFGEKKVGDEKNKEQLKGAIQALSEVVANPSTPKMIRKSVTDLVTELLTDEYSKSVRAANAISVLDDITQDPNLPSYVRVTLWQAVSKLEGIRE